MVKRKKGACQSAAAGSQKKNEEEQPKPTSPASPEQSPITNNLTFSNEILANIFSHLPTFNKTDLARFISLKGYVTEYDWNGVFTEEKAAQILEQADDQ